MPLDGLRAWIGEVERKLGMRTRVFLVLATIAIGGAGAAIYLAVETRDSAVSESDVQELQEQLEAQIDALETRAATEAGTGTESNDTPTTEPSEPAGNQGAGKESSESPVPKGKLRELIEEAKEKDDQLE